MPSDSVLRRSECLLSLVIVVRVLIVALPLVCLLLLIPVEGWLPELLRQFRFWCAGLGGPVVCAVEAN